MQQQELRVLSVCSVVAFFACMIYNKGSVRQVLCCKVCVLTWCWPCGNVCAGFNRPTLTRVQVGLMSLARELKGDLDRIAARADTGSSQGLHRLLQGEQRRGFVSRLCADGGSCSQARWCMLCSQARWCMKVCFVLDRAYCFREGMCAGGCQWRYE